MKRFDDQLRELMHASPGEPLLPSAGSTASSWTLRAGGASLDEPDDVFVSPCHRYRACQARTLINPVQGCAGLALRLDEQHHYGIEAFGTEVRGLVHRRGACLLGRTSGAHGPERPRSAESR
ncbi:hypothetical protein P8605_01490 [Streptomyces sp. T-3]|nr:hypothetical protein [Streptomyces sp. T-3]